MDEEARCLVVAVAHGFDEGLGSVLRARRRRHPNAQDLTAPKVEDDKGVENLKAHGDDGEPVSGPLLSEN